MIVCLAAIECNTGLKDIYARLEQDNYLKYGLVSYFYLKNQEELDFILTKVQKVLIDSGAHSFQHGKKVDFDDYTNKYKDFIKRNTNNPNILGFFEMDVDNVIGYDKVLEYRKQLEEVSDKIIPVWHNNRGVEDFVNMCKQYAGKRIAITGFANNDITDAQYNLFINTAHKYNCYVHILGMTRFELIQKLNLGRYDSVDSSSWKQTGIFGGCNIVKNKYNWYKVSCLEGIRNINYKDLFCINFETARRIQENYLEVDNSVIK